MTVYNGTIFNDSISQSSLSSGDDTVYTSTGSDYVQASAGNDTYNLGYASTIYYFKYGFNDFDTLDYRFLWQQVFGATSTSNIRIVADLAAGTVKKYNGSTLLSTDTVTGVDAIWGAKGNDTIWGRNNYNYEEFRGYGGNDTIDGRGGEDAVNYSYAAAAITVNLGNGTVTSTDIEVGSDTLRNVENIIGSNQADTFDARTFGFTSTNKTSFASVYNVFSPLGGDDTILGNGETIVNYSSVGGALTIDLSGQTSLSTMSNIVKSFTADSDPNTFSAGNISVSGVYFVIGGNFADTLTGGGKVNDNGAAAANTLSGDISFEMFRGRGGDDTISGGTGFDRSDYRESNPMTQGIQVNMAAGTVVGDALMIGTDTIRNVESVRGTYTDDVYDATGFTLTNAAAPSANAGDIKLTLPTGVTLPTLAFNEFVTGGGVDIVTGNGATRVTLDFQIERSTTLDSRTVFTSEQGGTIEFGLADGGLGSVAFTGTFSVRGGTGRDNLVGSVGYQNLQGGLNADTLKGGDGIDVLYGNNGNNEALPAGFSDNDLLDGGAGNDILRGDYGDDALIGGLGADRLEGGLGNDTYRYASSLESGITAADRDTIAGWNSGDKIDLSVIDANTANGSSNDAFSATFVSAFTAGAPGQLRFDGVAGILYGNTDGDVDAEFSILLSGVTSLSASDVIL